MNTLHVKYLIVGGGLAGSSAAKAIRAHDTSGSVLLVGQEVNRPYHRPALHKEFLLGTQERVDLSILPVGWFVDNSIDLRTGRRLSYIDTARNAVTLDSGEDVAFDKMLLALGTSPKPTRIAGSELPNVFYLRTLNDADRLHHAIQQSKAEGRPHSGGRGRVAIIGGGLLGVELAASLLKLGLHVELLTTSAHPWSKLAGETVGRFIANHLERHSAVVQCGNAVVRFEGDGRVQRLILASGSVVECDLVVIAQGSLFNRDVLRNTPIAAEKAILVNERCQTNVENIYAAGDCSAIFDPLFKKHRIIEHWEHAWLTGAIAGTNMAGDDARYDAVSHYTSEVFGLKLAAWGEPRHVHHRLVRGNSGIESKGFVEIGMATDGRISHVVKVGSVDDRTDQLSDLVRYRVQASDKEELLKDPSRRLSDLS